MSTFEIITKINDEDKIVALAIEKELCNIEKAVEVIVKSFEMGGRLFYIGSGTSGKLGVMDASECPPTFGVSDSMVQGIISGGVEALSGWLEHTEDVKPINKKLQKRVFEIVKLATDKDDALVIETLEICQYDPKVSIIKIKKDVTVEKAREALEHSNGNVAKALDLLN